MSLLSSLNLCLFLLLRLLFEVSFNLWFHSLWYLLRNQWRKRVDTHYALEFKASSSLAMVAGSVKLLVKLSMLLIPYALHTLFFLYLFGSVKTLSLYINFVFSSVWNLWEYSQFHCICVIETSISFLSSDCLGKNKYQQNFTWNC